MNSSLKKAYELLHFPLFLCVLISCQFTVGRGDSAIQAGIDPLPIATLERDVLWVLSRLANLSTVESFLIACIVVLLFTIASTNRRQFIMNQILYHFFLFFFTVYFLSRIAPEMASYMTAWVSTSIAMACVLVAAFSGAPAFVLRWLSNRAARRTEERSLVVASFKGCKECGAQFLSNPQYCARCLTKLG